MENFNPDELFLIAIELDMPSLLEFCASNSRFNNLICNRDKIWEYKLEKEFKNEMSKEVKLNNEKLNNEIKNFSSLNKSPRNLYYLLYS